MRCVAADQSGVGSRAAGGGSGDGDRNCADRDGGRHRALQHVR